VVETLGQETTARAERRRREILDAARSLVSRKGFEAARMDEVAAAVGVTKPAVYRYFPSKDHLITALMEADLIEPTRTLSRFVAGYEGPIEELLRAYAARAAEIQSQGVARGYLVLAIDEAQRRPGIAAAFRQQVLAPGLEALAGAFDRAMAAGELKAGHDPQMMSRLFFAPFLQLALVRGGVVLPMEDAQARDRYIEFHVDAFLRAFAA